MTANNHTAISLPAGSFELADLEKIGDQAVRKSPEDHAAFVNAALEKANQRPDRLDLPGSLPGHRLETVERVLAEGVEEPVPGGKKGETFMSGEVRVTEQVQVFDRAIAEEEIKAAAAPPASAGLEGTTAEARAAASSSAAAAGA